MNFNDFDSYMSGRRTKKGYANYDSLLLKEKKELYRISKNELMKKCNRCNNLLSVHDKRYSYCVLIRKKMILQQTFQNESSNLDNVGGK